MPWYCNPMTTCKVLNRIASRYPHASVNDLNRILSSATQILWDKQERYYRKMRKDTITLGPEELH